MEQTFVLIGTKHTHSILFVHNIQLFQLFPFEFCIPIPQYLNITASTLHTSRNFSNNLCQPHRILSHTRYFSATIVPNIANSKNPHRYKSVRRFCIASPQHLAARSHSHTIRINNTVLLSSCRVVSFQHLLGCIAYWLHNTQTKPTRPKTGCSASERACVI